MFKKIFSTLLIIAFIFTNTGYAASDKRQHISYLRIPLTVKNDSSKARIEEALKTSAGNPTMNKEKITGRVDLKKGPSDTKWWEEATMAELAKDPAPWGNDAIVPVESKKGVLEVTLTAKMFEEWSPENPEGRDLDASTNKYDEIGPLAIAGIRHVMNIANVHDTRQVKNSVERLLTTVALGLMIKIKYNKGAGFPFLTNYGHEVRYNSQEFQDITTRILAAMGFICNVVPGNVPVAIWDTSTMGKMFDMPLSFCGTSSHSPSSVDGLKIMDYEGSQFLISDIQALIAIKKAIVRHVKEKGSFTFTLAAENDPRVTDQLYRSTDNGMAVYKEYQEKTAADELILGLIRTLDPSRVHIDCMHGSGYRTLKAFFKKMGLNDVTDKIDWMHTEERPDFGNIGKAQEDPKSGKSKLFDLGADGTQMMERVMPDGTIVKYFPVLCTADYPEKLAKMPIGDIILPTDMDNDRLFYIQIMANDDATRELLDETGVVYNVINAEKIAAVHIPNKSFHLLQDMNLQRITSLMRQGKIDKRRTVVILKTLASTPAVDQWADKKAAELEKEGIKLKVINTAVGFAKLANVMYRTEGYMRAHPGKDVVISDAAGKDINIGPDPVILAAWEESGGIIVGATEKISDLLGNSFLAMREKSATESIFLSLALISKLQQEKGAVDFAAYLKEIYAGNGVTTPKDLRYDNALYVPAATKESALEEIAGNERKNRIFGAYLSIVIAKMQNQLSVENAKKILRDMFDQEYEARKTQAQLSPVLIERFSNVNFNFLKDMRFTGDGVMFVFEKNDKEWFVLFRPSGTEPKLKAYGFGDDAERLAIDAWSFGFNENTKGTLPGSFTGNEVLMELWGSDGVKAVDKARRMQQAWEDFGLVVDPEYLGPMGLEQLETRRLIRNFSPPDNHLELVNEWLKERGLPLVDIDFSKPQAMPQEAIAELLESVPEDVYNSLGHTKEDVLKKEKARLASNETFAEEKHGARVIAGKLQDTPLDAKGDKAMAASFLRGGYNQEGYGVAEGASIHGTLALVGNQGYYAEGGKEAFVGTVNSMKEFFKRRAERLGKPIKYVIKTGIGGQHTPFQGIADVFQVINPQTWRIVGEYELGKDYEASITSALRDLNADWDQVAVIPSSKSGSTDETMMVFVDILSVLLKHQAINKGIDGDKFANLVLAILHEVNFIGGKERAGKDLFKVDGTRFGTTSLISLIANNASRQGLNVTRDQVKDIFGKVLGNMFFETTDRVDQSRLSAFVHNSGLDTELGEDKPGFGAMFDNVGGRWTGDLHMMTFLAYHGLNAEQYWNTAKAGRAQVKEGSHIANQIGNKILDEGITDIALVVPDVLFWFGKSNEQNFNESIWQSGFANLVTIRKSQWDAQKEHYRNDKKKLVIDMTGDAAVYDVSFNVAAVKTSSLGRLTNRELANAFAEFFTVFYGITTVVGDRLIARALKDAGYTADDVDLNDVSNPATKIVQQNLYVRQPYVELGKGLLESKLKALQEQEAANPGTIEEELGKIKQLAREGKIDTNISELKLPAGITNLSELASAMRKADEFARANGRKFVPFVYLEGDRFYDLRDYLISIGIEWVMQGTGDQHISYQQVLAQPQKYLPFVISFVPEKTLPGKPAIGFAKGYLNNVSPHMVRDLFAEASYKALTELRKDQGGRGLFLRMIDSDANIDMLKQAAAKQMSQTLASNAAVNPFLLFEPGKDRGNVSLDKKTIVIAMGGGDTAGLNDFIAGVVERLAEKGYRVVGVKNGFKGLKAQQLEDNLVELTLAIANKMKGLPGVVIGSCREKLSGEDDARDIVGKIRNAGGIIFIGGNDHLKNVEQVADEVRRQGIYDLPVIGAPKSIDNDFMTVMHGFWSAVIYGREISARLSNKKFAKEASVFECMGRKSGSLTLELSKACPYSKVVIVPEIQVTINDVIYAANSGVRNFFVSEGFSLSENDPKLKELLEAYPVLNTMWEKARTSPDKDVHGNPKLTGVSLFVKGILEHFCGIAVERTDLTYQLRGAFLIPDSKGVVFDTFLAGKFAEAAVELLIKKQGGLALTYDAEYGDINGKVVPKEPKDVYKSRDLLSMMSSGDLAIYGVLGASGYESEHYSESERVVKRELSMEDAMREAFYAIGVSTYAHKYASVAEFREPSEAIVAACGENPDNIERLPSDIRTVLKGIKDSVFILIPEEEAGLSEIAERIKEICSRVGYVNIAISKNFMLDPKDRLLNMVLAQDPVLRARFEKEGIRDEATGLVSFESGVSSFIAGLFKYMIKQKDIKVDGTKVTDLGQAFRDLESNANGSMLTRRGDLLEQGVLLAPFSVQGYIQEVQISL